LRQNCRLVRRGPDGPPGEASAKQMHDACVSHWLDHGFGPYEWLPERGSFACAATEDLVAKVWKPHRQRTTADAAAAIDHSREKFLRGSHFAPSIHLRWEAISCLAGSGQPCNAAVVMRRLPFASRLDRLFADLSSEKQPESIELLFESHRRAVALLAPSDASTELSLNRADDRIMDQIDPQLEAGGQNLKRLWLELRAARQPLMDEIRRRDRDGTCRQTHGDLAADNIYIDSGVVHWLDPCVTYPELYEVDSALDWAQLIVTLGSIQSRQTSALIARGAREAGISASLMSHYVARTALIRFTMRELSRNLSRRPAHSSFS
jgi:hypothetical protein